MAVLVSPVPVAEPPPLQSGWLRQCNRHFLRSPFLSPTLVRPSASTLLLLALSPVRHDHVSLFFDFVVEQQRHCRGRRRRQRRLRSNRYFFAFLSSRSFSPSGSRHFVCFFCGSVFVVSFCPLFVRSFVCPSVVCPLGRPPNFVYYLPVNSIAFGFSRTQLQTHPDAMTFLVVVFLNRFGFDLSPFSPRPRPLPLASRVFLLWARRPPVRSLWHPFFLFSPVFLSATSRPVSLCIARVGVLSSPVSFSLFKFSSSLFLPHQICSGVGGGGGDERNLCLLLYGSLFPRSLRF